jgi:hypothetical protein
MIALLRWIRGVVAVGLRGTPREMIAHALRGGEQRKGA